MVAGEQLATVEWEGVSLLVWHAPLPEGDTAAIVQACVLHLIRNSFHYAGRHDWEKMAKDLRPIYQAINADVAAAQLEEFASIWGQKYPAIVRLWRSAWAEFTPFLEYDVEIRKIISSTSAIESLNARYRLEWRYRAQPANADAEPEPRASDRMPRRA